MRTQERFFPMPTSGPTDVDAALDALRRRREAQRCASPPCASCGSPEAPTMRRLLHVDLGPYHDVLLCLRCGAFHVRVQHLGGVELSYGSDDEGVMTPPTDVSARVSEAELRAELGRWPLDVLRASLAALPPTT